MVLKALARIVNDDLALGAKAGIWLPKGFFFPIQEIWQ